MYRILGHLKANVVGYVALFVALGGTSYAAVILPADSVGSRQLRNGAVINAKLANGSVGPNKFDPGSIGGSIREWAWIRQNATVASGSRGASVKLAGNQFTVSWGTRFGARCAVIATPASVGVQPLASSIGVGINEPSSQKGSTSVLVWTYGNAGPIPAPFYIAVVC